MPKKILIFSLAYYPRFVGGAEVAIKEITDRVHDIEFHMVTLRFDSRLPRYERIGNVHVHRVGFGRPGAMVGTSYGLLWVVDKIFFVPFAALKALSLHKKEHLDGLWAMMTYMILPIALMRLLGTKLPYVITLQDGDPFEHVFKRPLIRPFVPLLRYGFRQASVVQTISTFLAEWPRRVGFEGSVVVVPNGTNVEHFAHVSAAALKTSQDEVALITTSRLVTKNALDDVIRALAHLKNTVHFYIVGTGPEEKNLRALAEKLGVKDRVHFVGAKDNNDLPAYLHGADIFVRPSRSEGMGISFIEAFAAGVPVIATQEGGLSDFISSQTAWVVRRDHPEDIAAQVKEILADPAHTRAVTEHAKTLAVEKYDWNIIAKDMREKVFSRIL